MTLNSTVQRLAFELMDEPWSPMRVAKDFSRDPGPLGNILEVTGNMLERGVFSWSDTVVLPKRRRHFLSGSFRQPCGRYLLRRPGT